MFAITPVGTTGARVPVTDELVVTLGGVAVGDVVVVTGADVVTGTEVVVVGTDAAGAGVEVTGVDVVEVVEGVDDVDVGVAEGGWPVRIEAAAAIDLVTVGGTNVVAGVDDVLALTARDGGHWSRLRCASDDGGADRRDRHYGHPGLRRGCRGYCQGTRGQRGRHG